jgi:ribonuclease T2
MTPSPWLIQHEWAKHGTCMSPRPDAYFKAASILYRAVRYPDMAALSKRVQTVGTFKRAFAAANPGVSADMLAVQIGKSGWLQEVRICLDRRMKPTRCLSGQERARDRKLLRIRR